MDEMKNRAKGIVDETLGKAKRAVGDAMDRPDIRAEGDAQEARGDAEKEAARREEVRKDNLYR